MCLDGKCPPPGKTCNDGNSIDWDGCTDGDLSEFLVNTHTADWQENPVVAAFSEGGFVVIWRSKFQDGDLQGIYAQRYKADGTEAGSEFKVTTETEDDQEHPAAATFDDDRFVVVWESWGQDGSAEGVFGQFFNPDGNKSGPEFQVNTATMADQDAPAVAALDGDGIAVAWDGTNPEADWNGIYGQLVDLEGGLIGEEFQVNTHAAGEQKHPAVAGLAGGGFVVAWASEMQDQSGYGVFAQLFDAGAGKVGEEFQVNGYTTGDQQDAVAIPLTGGGFVIGWQSLNQDNSGFGIVVARFDEDGNQAGMESMANSFTPGDQKDLALAPTGDGGFLAAWASKAQDGSDYGVFVRRFLDDGNSAYEEFQANTFTESIQRRPGIAAQPGGSMAVVWHGWEQAGEDSGYDIYAARFDQNGNMLFH